MSEVEERIDGELDNENYLEVSSEEVENNRPKKKSGRFKWLLLLLITSLVGGSYFLYQQEFKPVKENVDKLRAQLSGGKIQQVETALDQQADAIADLRDKQATQNTILQHNAVQLNAATQPKPEASFDVSNSLNLLRAADDRAYLLGDTRMALDILETVSKRLMSQNQLPQLAALISEDMVRLESYKPLDINEVMFSLNALLSGLRPAPDIERVNSAEEQGKPLRKSIDGNEISAVWDRFQRAVSDRVTFIEYDQQLNAINNKTINQHKLELLKLKVETLRVLLASKALDQFTESLKLTSNWVSDNLESSQASAINTELNKLATINFPVVPRLKSARFRLDGLSISAQQLQNSQQPEATRFSDTSSSVLPQDAGHLGLPALEPQPFSKPAGD